MKYVLIKVFFGGRTLDSEEMSILMEKVKLLDNDELNRLIQYCRIMKKANDVKEGKKAPRVKKK